MLFVIMISFMSIISCTGRKSGTPAGSLLRADRDFSAMSEKEGMFRAFLEYIDEEGVILRDNSMPEKGRVALEKRFSGRSDTSFILTWEPLSEIIAESGEIGYTYGIHTTRDKASGDITKGTYVTIWRKQPGGKWKFILDTGTQGLPLD